ncbi:hypothetical protein ACHAW6_013522 [Cyclotella cf. meneghiniana]
MSLMTASMPPLLPKVDAILVLDGEGNRLAGKYYGDFMKTASPSDANGSTDNATATQSAEQLRQSFERQLQSKIGGIAARPDAAEVVTVLGKTAVFCGGSAPGQGGGSVRVVHVGPAGESELVLAHLAEGMYDALSQLMGGSTDRNMILDNLELVFLLIDEHCDGGIILETDGHKLASSVLLRDEQEASKAEEQAQAKGGKGIVSGAFGGMGGDMTIAQALRQAREQILSNLNQN